MTAPLPSDDGAIGASPSVTPDPVSTLSLSRTAVIVGSFIASVVLASTDPFLGLLAILGFVGAFLSGLVGIGGAIVMIPLLLFVPPALGFETLDFRTIAAITIVQVAVASTAGAIGHRGRVDRSLVIAIGVPMTVASFIGAMASAVIEPVVLEAVFATMAAAAAVLTLRRRHRTAVDRPGAVAFNRPGAAGLGAGVGGLAGMVGAGGAFLLIPGMLFGLKVPMRAAVAASLVVVAFAASAGVVGKAATGQIDWLLAAGLVAGAIPGGLIGTLVSHRTKVEHLATILGIIVGLVALRMWVEILS